MARPVSGYGDQELEDIQQKWRLRFPPDLVAIYRQRRSVIRGGFDWVKTPVAEIRQMLDWPLEGFLFDVKHGKWWPEWAERPEQIRDAEEKVRAIFAKAPRLIPIHGHRYIPEEPHEIGNPVFSVWQMDVIHYGANLDDYVEREEQRKTGNWPALKSIRFWTRAVELNAGDEPFAFYNKGGVLPE